MKMSQDVFQIHIDCILEQCPRVIGIHDDMIIYGYTREDHDTNLVNFLNVRPSIVFIEAEIAS